MLPHKTILLALSFFTRLPLRRIAPPMDAMPLAAAVWAFPVAGAVIGLLGGIVYTLCVKLGIAGALPAALAVAAQLWITGGLHEDGLSDTADGFAGGFNREKRLAIMRDSRIGSFGALALILALYLRVEALSLIATPVMVMRALIVSAAVSRAMIGIGMLVLPSARPDGLAAWAGRPVRWQVLLGAGIAFAIALPLAGKCALALLLVALMACGAVCLLSQRKIGGITGDVYGTIQQVSEIAVLVAATVLLHY